MGSPGRAGSCRSTTSRIENPQDRATCDNGCAAPSRRLCYCLIRATGVTGMCSIIRSGTALNRSHGRVPYRIGAVEMDQLIAKLSKLDIVRGDLDYHLIRATMVI